MMLLNRDGRTFKLPEDGWYQLTPLGEFPATREYDDGTEEEVLQLVDAEAVAEMANRFAAEKAKPNFAGVLVDFDHFSHDKEKSSRAAGWMMDVQNRADGLWAQIDWSVSGKAALEGGDFRFISPVWDGPAVGKRGKTPLVRPTVLNRAAVTNDPNLKGSLPLSNRAGGGHPGDKPKPETTMKLQTTTILAMAAALGLSPESTDEQVIAALPGAKDLLNRGREFATLKPQYDALLDAQAEADLTLAGITDAATRADLKPALIANRDQGLKFLKLVKPEDKGARKPLTNRATAGNPDTSLGDAGEEKEKAAAEARAAKISNRARALRTSSPTLGLQQSYQLAEQEITQEETAA